MSQNLKPVLALLVVYVIWGTTIGSIRIGVESIPSPVLPVLRFTMAGLLLIGLCMLQGERLPERRELRVHLIAGVLLFILGNTLVCWSVKEIPTGLGAMLVATTPFWMTLLSAVIAPRERITVSMWAGIAMGFAGMLILLSPQLSHVGSVSPVTWLSLSSFVVMAFCWSLGSIYLRRRETRASMLMSVGLQNLFAGLLLIPVIAMMPETRTFQPSLSSLAALGYLVVFGTAVATPCYYYLLKELPIAVSGTVSYVTPVVSVLFGWLFLHETVTYTTVLGSGIVLLSVMFTQMAGLRKPQPAPVLPLNPAPLNPTLTPPEEQKAS